MTRRTGVRAGLAISLLAGVLSTACTGGQEGTAAEEKAPQKNGVATTAAAPAVDVKQELKTISDSIPLYAGARYRDDLTRRDAVMIRNQYGAGAQVYTLATDDSYPQVFHYYTTYLAQFRAFPATNPYPPERENWRTLEVQLNNAMQDPFIPGAALRADGRQVILQIAETEAEPKTVIRYIVAPAAPVAAVTASAPATSTAAAEPTVAR
jgi:hypothetical protein